jgi:putative FmdB family regulatory protein
MPIYAYKCSTCGHSKDVLQKMSDALLTDCPACGAATFSKQLTAAGFQLKGSGWYATDFKGGATTAAAPVVGADAGGSGGTKAASEVKSDTKSDTKSSDSAAPASTPSSAPAASAGGCSTGCACH